MSKPTSVQHVAVLFEFPTLNGGEHSMLSVLDALRAEGAFQFTALAPGTGLLADELTKRQIPVREFSVRNEFGEKLPFDVIEQRLSGLLQELRPDILHANSLSMSRLTGQLAGATFPPLKRTGHLRDIIRLNKKTVSDLNRNDGLIAVSKATSDFHVAQGLDPLRCRVIHNGVDTERFQPRNSATLRKKLFPSIPAAHRILLNVGQICLRKGQLDLAKAVVGLLQDHSDVHLAFVGQRHSTKQESVDYEAAIQQQFTRAGCDTHLHMLGYRDDIPELMNAGDLLVHAARQEPFGRTLLEAASSGLPIIATDVGGTTELLRPETDAILVSSGDVASLQAVIRRALLAPELCSSLAASARRRIEANFAIENAADQLAKFWNIEEDRVTDYSVSR
ncbi:MAG: glycosyltransferase family 4 protein [Fuerstiella sp.]|nr:glycosyltransferase family 4 protein [Fuerstiella sp.]